MCHAGGPTRNGSPRFVADLTADTHSTWVILGIHEMQTSITSWLQKSSSSSSSKEANAQLVQDREHDDEVLPSIRLGNSASGTSSDGKVGNQATEIQIVTSQKQTQPLQPLSNIDFVINPRPLAPNVDISEITSELLPQFKRLISVLLPVPYSTSFYSEILTDDIAKELSLVAIWKEHGSQEGKVVSGIRCKLLARSPRLASGSKIENDTSGQVASPQKDSGEGPSLYIATVATYAPYRGHGIASALMQRLIKLAVEDYGVTTVTAHVWEGASETREWYRKLGFKEVKYQAEYHRRLEPKGAFLVEAKVGDESMSK
jgi:ribosomal protein S18 acetylase RimI-like enzyme